MRNTLNLVWKLLLICLVAGLVLGLVNQVTKDRIDKLNEDAKQASIREAFPDAAELVDLRKETVNAETGLKVENFFRAVDKDGNTIGYVASSKAHGYGSDIEVVVGMDMTGKVVGCVVGKNGDFGETAGLGAKVQDPAFAAQFKDYAYDGKTFEYTPAGGDYLIKAGSLIVEKTEGAAGGIQAVSGATYSSTAVKNAFNAVCAELYKQIGGAK